MEKGLEMEDCFFDKKLPKMIKCFILFGLGFQWEAVVYLTHSWARMIWDAATQVQI
jgi:hypothetical protein